MAYTEKVSLSGTALSFLLYECANSVNSSQEGFLIGDITSEITNHISDSQSDNARLDTQIEIRTVLPLPTVSLFYLSTGRLKEDTLAELLSKTANEVVGWYKYRKNSSLKPTFRDKLISKGLQKYFEKHHGKKTFVTCNLSNKTSASASTHTYTYRFGKINCLDMYEYIEDVTANLGEKLTGYKKGHSVSHTSHSVFNKILNDSNVETNNSSDAILSIQQAVDIRLAKEAKIAAKNESTIRELQAEINQMTNILRDKHASDLQENYDKLLKEEIARRETEMAESCIQAMSTTSDVDVLSTPNIILNNNLCSLGNGDSGINSDIMDRSPSPILSSITKPVPNYAAALKKKTEVATSSKSSNFTEDLISFEDEKAQVLKPVVVRDDVIRCVGDSSPEY